MNVDNSGLLLSRPDIAAEVGFLFMHTANLEGWLVPILTELLGSEKAAMAVVVNVDSLSAKWAVVFDIAEANPDKPVSATLRRYKHAIRAVIAYRNALAHGIFNMSADGELYLVHGVTSNRRGPIKTELLSAAQIRTYVEGLRAVLGCIRLEMPKERFKRPTPAWLDTLAPTSQSTEPPPRGRTTRRRRNPLQSSQE